MKEIISKIVNWLVSSNLIKFFLRNYFLQLDETWNRTSVNVESFISQNSEVLKKIEFSHSFSPEQMEWISTIDEFENKNKASSIETVKFFYEKLKIKNIRLGIRWSDVDQNGNINLEKYKSLISFALENNLSICLNIGPIKTFRWPEVYIPQRFLNNFNKNIIDSNSEISKASLNYLEKLFKQFEIDFGKDFFEKVEVIQPENEMYNPFGPTEWTVSESHMINVIKLIKNYFPKSKILISVSGGPNSKNIFTSDISKAQNLILKIKNFFDPKKLIIGINYYYKIPGMPIDKNGMMLDNFSLLKFLRGKSIFKKAFDFSKENGNELEISELQFEHWGEINTPGTSFQEFQFSLLRVLDELNIKDYDNKFVIRLWGSELFAQRILSKSSTNDMQKIMDLIIKIQTL